MNRFWNSFNETKNQLNLFIILKSNSFALKPRGVCTVIFSFMSVPFFFIHNTPFFFPSFFLFSSSFFSFSFVIIFVSISILTSFFLLFLSSNPSVFLPFFSSDLFFYIFFFSSLPFSLLLIFSFITSNIGVFSVSTDT